MPGYGMKKKTGKKVTKIDKMKKAKNAKTRGRGRPIRTGGAR